MLTNMCLFDLTIACVEDAAWVNTVFALRGFWGVILAWLVAKRWGGHEAKLSRPLLLKRLCGAGLLTLGVVLAVAFPF